MTTHLEPRRELVEVEIPAHGDWVSFWADGKRYTVAGDEPGVWTLLRHRKKAATAVATFAETDGWFVEVAPDGTAVGNPAPSWRAFVLRYV